MTEWASARPRCEPHSGVGRTIASRPAAMATAGSAKGARRTVSHKDRLRHSPRLSPTAAPNAVGMDIAVVSAATMKLLASARVQTGFANTWRYQSSVQVLPGNSRKRDGVNPTRSDSTSGTKDVPTMK